MSTTEYCDYDVIPMTPGLQIPSAVGLTLLIIVAVTGNVFTMVAYLRDRSLNTVYDFYIFNLAITDLLLSCISMPFYAVYTLTEFTWPFGYGFCKVWLILDFTLCFESIMIMLILSLDRLLMISMGSDYMIKITKRVAVIQIVSSWIISFLVYSPAIIGWNHWVGYSTVEVDDCDVEFAYDHLYTTITSIIEFVLPFVCLTFLNALIYYKIRQRIRVSPKEPTRYVTQSEPANSDTVTEVTVDKASDGRNIEAGDDINKTNSTMSVAIGTSQTYTSPSTQYLSQINNSTNRPNQYRSNTTKAKTQVQTTSAQRQAKAAKFLAMLVVAFLFFWAPYITTTMAISFCDECINTSLYEFFNWLLWMKSAVNPFLYAYNSPRYKAHFQRYISCNGRLPIFGRTATNKNRTRGLRQGTSQET